MDKTFTLLPSDQEEVWITNYYFTVIQDDLDDEEGGRIVGEVSVRCEETYRGSEYTWKTPPSDELLSMIGDTKEQLLERVKDRIERCLGEDLDVVECNPKQK